MIWGSFFSALCYLGLFLFGLHFMSSTLSQTVGTMANKIMGRLVGAPYKGFLSGCVVTTLVQSSSLTSVMVVGMVNARIMTLTQGIAVIIGANVGTTVTAQLLSFDIQHLALPLVGIASFLYLLPYSRTRSFSAILLGFGLMLLGLRGLTASLAPLQNAPFVTIALSAAAENPFKGVGAGIVISALVQSSSAVMGTVLGMAKEGIIPLPAAVAILMGADLGTCLTALAASLGMNPTARSAAWSHLAFNLVSLLLALLFFPYLLKLTVATGASLPRQLANFHTLYNLMGAFALMPLIPLWVRLLKK